MNGKLKQILQSLRATAPTHGAFAIGNTNTNSSVTPTCTNTATATANSLMVLSIASAEDGNDGPLGCNVGSVPALNWKKIVYTKALHSGNTEIWVAPFAAGGSITTKASKINIFSSGISTALYNFPNGNVNAPYGGFQIAVNQSLPSITYQTIYPASVLVCVTSDWAATAGAHTYRDSATELIYDFQTAIYAGAHFYKVTTSAGSYTEGLTAPTGAGETSMSLIEIVGY